MNSTYGILQDEADRKVYLDLPRKSTEQHGVALIGYCLMSNHVHLAAVPRNADASQQSDMGTSEACAGRQLMPLGDS
jgi:REP element-mobilizing transposase RayT